MRGEFPGTASPLSLVKAQRELCEPQARGLKRIETAMASVKEIEGLLTGIPPVQYVAAGSCGVKYVSKGLEIVCC